MLLSDSVLRERKPQKSRTLIESFNFAIAGLWYTLQTQRNARIHLAIAAVVTIAGIVVGLSPSEFAILALTFAMVVVAETINTVIELVVDMVSKELNGEAKVAKDIAAAVVLITAVGAVAVGMLIFIPRLLLRS